jgi:hypothetical protein
MEFVYKLELKDGTPADPPTLRAAVPDWHVGDTGSRWAGIERCA